MADTVLHHLDGLLGAGPDTPARDHLAKRRSMRRRLEMQLGEPDAPQILRCFFALELFAIDDDAGARMQLDAALAKDARLAPIVALFRAQQERTRGRFDRAEDFASHCLALDSSVFRGRDSAYAVLADAQDQLGRTGDAIATTRLAIAESPAVLSHAVNLAVLEGRATPPVPAFALGPGARPSIFLQQDALLGRYRPTRTSFASLR